MSFLTVSTLVLSVASFRMSFLLVGVNGFVYLTHLSPHDYKYVRAHTNIDITGRKSQFDTHKDAPYAQTPIRGGPSIRNYSATIKVNVIKYFFFMAEMIKGHCNKVSVDSCKS